MGTTVVDIVIPQYGMITAIMEHSDTPPVLVDKSGGFDGYFTCNRYKDKRVEAGLMDYLCENREALKADLRESYYRLFR